MATDRGYGEFDSELQDEYTFDAHYPPGVEIGDAAEDGDLPSFSEGLPPVPDGFLPEVVEDQGPLRLHPDYGSGSCAEDGPLEVAEGRAIMDGENILGSAAMYGPTEIGDELGVAQKVARAVQAVKNAVVAKKTAPPRVAAQHAAVAQQAVAVAEHALASGPYSSHGASELGAASAADRAGSELGSYAEHGPSEVGGAYAEDGAAELGSFAERGASEVGESLMQPFESFMLENDRLGDDEDSGDGGLEHADDGSEIGLYAQDGASELGAGHYPSDGASEIGEAQQKAAVVKVVEKARDNRRPAPPMKAVNVDAPLPDESDDFLSDIVIGAAVAAPAGKDPFPLLSQLLLRAGATVEPRIVRVDTEESYKAFRTAQSPELSELREKLEAHVADPDAHELEGIDDDIADLVLLGEEVQAVESQKRVELWMPKRFQGKLEAWREGEMVCASIALPGHDGELRICTSFEPVTKCVDEMVRHASEAKVPAATVVGVLPAMGCVLGAGTVLKEVAAAAPAILARPEAQMKMPFMVRIEPKMAPHLAALVMLAAGCRGGNKQACDEWSRLSGASAGPVRQAMVEAVELLKAATGA